MCGTAGCIEDVNGGYVAFPDRVHESGEEQGAPSVSGAGLYEKIRSEIEDDLLVYPHVKWTLLSRDAHPGSGEPRIRCVVIQPVELIYNRFTIDRIAEHGCAYAMDPPWYLLSMHGSRLAYFCTACLASLCSFKGLSVYGYSLPHTALGLPGREHMKLARHDVEAGGGFRLEGRRVLLRQLEVRDFEAWRESRSRCREWLRPWEPRPAGAGMAAEDWTSFQARLSSRERERQLGSGYGFGSFIGDVFAGEVTISSIQRGPFQSAYIGYWVDQRFAGQGIAPEATCLVMRFAFEVLGLHRIEIAIVPRNGASRRVAEKLGLRIEGIAERFLEINGVWEDHVRYAMTVEEWVQSGLLMSKWLPDQ